MNRQYVQLLLSCDSNAEATTIADALLDRHLIVCAKRVPIESKFWWDGGIETGDEVLLMMDTSLDLYDEIEIEVARHHSYETFVLQAVPFIKTSRSASTWMNENLKPAKE